MVFMWTSSTQAVEGFPMIPDCHFLLGHLPLMRESDDFRLVQYKFSVEHTDEHGRCCFWMGPTTPALSVTSARDVQLVLKSSTHRTVFPIMLKHLDECLGKRNIGVLMGKEWKLHRSAILKALHGGVSSEQHGKKMVKATMVLVKSLTNKLEQEEEEEEKGNCMQVENLMKYLTMDIFGLTNMTTNFGCCEKLELSPIAASFEFLTDEMMRRINGMVDPTNYFYSLPLAKNRQHEQHRQFLKSFVSNVVEERKELLTESSDTCPQDVLTSLIQIQQDPEYAELSSEETLTDVLMSLLLAGHETTSVTLTYALYLVSQHPHVKEECLKEIDSMSEDGNNLEANSLQYTQAVILETLRLYPPAICTTRSLEIPLVLPDSSSEIPQGTYMYVPIWHVQRDAKHFPNPDEFIPERWVTYSNEAWQERRNELDSDSSTAVPPANRDAFCAFSAGARSCAGQRFAKQEMTLALAILLQHFSFEPKADYVLEPHRTGFVQKPKHGMPMRISVRTTN